MPFGGPRAKLCKRDRQKAAGSKRGGSQSADPTRTHTPSATPPPGTTHGNPHIDDPTAGGPHTDPTHRRPQASPSAARRQPPRPRHPITRAASHARTHRERTRHTSVQTSRRDDVICRRLCVRTQRAAARPCLPLPAAASPRSRVNEEEERQPSERESASERDSANQSKCDSSAHNGSQPAHSAQRAFASAPREDDPTARLQTAECWRDRAELRQQSVLTRCCCVPECDATDRFVSSSRFCFARSLPSFAVDRSASLLRPPRLPGLPPAFSRLWCERPLVRSPP